MQFGPFVACDFGGFLSLRSPPARAPCPHSLCAGWYQEENVDGADKAASTQEWAHAGEGRIAVSAGVPKATNGFEWKTRRKILGLPLICIAFGADEKGRPRVAKGFIALGQFAVGMVVIAQFGLGLISLGQVAVGVAAGGQLAVGLLTGIGQVCAGTFAVGQVVVGVYARGQVGWADYLWSPSAGPTWRLWPCSRPLIGS